MRKGGMVPPRCSRNGGTGPSCLSKACSGTSYSHVGGSFSRCSFPKALRIFAHLVGSWLSSSRFCIAVQGRRPSRKKTTAAESNIIKKGEGSQVKTHKPTRRESRPESLTFLILFDLLLDVDFSKTTILRSGFSGNINRIRAFDGMDPSHVRLMCSGRPRLRSRSVQGLFWHILFTCGGFIFSVLVSEGAPNLRASRRVLA